MVVNFKNSLIAIGKDSVNSINRVVPKSQLSKKNINKGDRLLKKRVLVLISIMISRMDLSKVMIHDLDLIFILDIL